MYDYPGSQAGGPRTALNQPDPLRNAFSGASAGLIRGGLGAYGEKIFGSSSEHVQSNISKWFSDPQYYFQVNGHYVRNKLKVVLLPFLQSKKGHWTRITEPVGGRLSYKPPVYDINAPDLYIPLMSFGTYLVLAGFTLGFAGNKFNPEALSFQFTKGLLGWFLQVLLLKGSACLFWEGLCGVTLTHAIYMSMHGCFPGEDDEENSFFRDEELRFKQATLFLALHGFGSVSVFLLAWDS